MSKRIKITLNLDERFVRLLHANVELSGGLMADKELDVKGQLARVVLAEARGALEEQVHACIQPAWRPHIHTEGDERRVYADGKQLSGPALAAEPTDTDPQPCSCGGPLYGPVNGDMVRMHALGCPTLTEPTATDGEEADAD